MPTDGCSVCMPIMFVYSKFWVLNRTLSHLDSRVISRETEPLRIYWSNLRIYTLWTKRVGLSIGTNIGSLHVIMKI